MTETFLADWYDGQPRRMEGVRLTIPGYEEFTFYADKRGNSWHITEAVTGRAVHWWWNIESGKDFDDLAAVIASSVKKWEESGGPEAIRRGISKTLLGRSITEGD